MSMTQEEQRIALAELEGWNTTKEQLGGVFHYRNPKGYIAGALPNYCFDLNAVHEFETRLSEHQQSEYIKFMIWNRIGPDNTNLVIWEAFVSTAAQRCEALCRVLWPERWKERV